ncbi:MAG: glycosyltransferase [Bacteroidales bacterium]
MKKNVGFIHIKYPYGGGEKVTTDISRYLIDRGYSVSIFVAELFDSKLGQVHSQINFVKLPDTNLSSTNNSQFLLAKIKELALDFFVVPDFQLSCLSQIKTQTDCKIIYQLHNVPLWEMIFKLAAGENNARKSFGRFIEWNLIRRWKYKFSDSYKKKIILYYKNTYDIVDSYVVLCDSYGKDIARIVGVDFENSKITALTNPTDQVANPEAFEKKKQILYVGRLLYAQKRVDRLLDIWSKLHIDFPDWELLIVGEGPELNSLQKYAKKLELDHLIFCGFTSKINEFYRNASILCLTSTYEGWPLVLVEAQANAVVPIAFNCCAGVEDILSLDNQNGILVSAFNLDEYAAKLGNLMRDDDLRRQIVAKNIERVRQYNISLIGRKWEELFMKLS